MAEIQLYAPKAGTQLSSSIVQPQNPNCLVELQLLNTIVGSQLQLSSSMADNPTVSLHGPKSTPNWRVFQNPQILSPSLPGMTVIHIPAQFPIWGLSWQLWLSSFVYEHKLYTNAMHLNQDPNSSKSNQTEW